MTSLSIFKKSMHTHKIMYTHENISTSLHTHAHTHTHIYIYIYMIKISGKMDKLDTFKDLVIILHSLFKEFL